MSAGPFAICKAELVTPVMINGRGGHVATPSVQVPGALCRREDSHRLVWPIRLVDARLQQEPTAANLQEKKQPKRHPLPTHLPRRDIHHEP